MDAILVFNLPAELQDRIAAEMEALQVPHWQSYDAVACQVPSLPRALEIARRVQEMAGDKLASMLLDGSPLRLGPPSAAQVGEAWPTSKGLVDILGHLLAEGQRAEVQALYGPAVLERLEGALASKNAGAELTAEELEAVLESLWDDSRLQSPAVLARTEL